MADSRDTLYKRQSAEDALEKYAEALRPGTPPTTSTRA